MAVERRATAPSEPADEPGRRDRQVANADAGRVVDGVGNRRRGADDADLADSLRAHRVDVQILLIDTRHLDSPTSAFCTPTPGNKRQAITETGLEISQRSRGGD